MGHTNDCLPSDFLDGDPVYIQNNFFRSFSETSGGAASEVDKKEHHKLAAASDMTESATFHLSPAIAQFVQRKRRLSLYLLSSQVLRYNERASLLGRFNFSHSLVSMRSAERRQDCSVNNEGPLCPLPM